ncbi:MAG: oligosaccharide flippase family protein [Chloroflexota bacterium]|nr:oligosaccharide flippase family protein [Lentimicrobium sp.]
MQRKFLANLGFLLLLNLIIKPVWIFGIDLNVQNTVGAEQYGLYFTLFNFSFLFNILFDFGITNFNNRNIAQNSQLLNKHFSSIVILKLLLGIVYFLITFSVAIIWGYRGTELYLLIFLGINQFLTSFILYLRSNISALLFFKTDSILSVLDRIVMIAICSVLLWGGITRSPFKIEWFVYSQTIALGITFIVAFLIVIKKASFRKLNWNYPFFLLILKQSLPYAVLVLLMAFYNKFDTVMLARLLDGPEGKIQSGIYAHSYRLLDAANNIAYLFSLLLLPIFARMIKTKAKINNMVRLSFSLLFVFSIIVSAVSFTFNYQVIGLLYDDHINESAKIFPVLMSCFVAISTSYVFGTLLTANGNLKQLNYLAATGMLMNVGLNLVLIPRYGALGSAWASLVTQAVMAIMQVVLSVIYFKLETRIKYLMKLAVFVIGVAVAGFLSVHIPAGWALNAGIMIILSVIWAMILQLLNLKHFIGLLKTRTRPVI